MAKRVGANNKEKAIEILKLFIDSFKEEIANLDAGHDQQDWETFKAIAHKRYSFWNFKCPRDVTNP